MRLSISFLVINFISLCKISCAREVTGETRENNDSCWDAGRGFFDWLPTAGDCQLRCSLTPGCNSWGYNMHRGDKRCHLCTWTYPRTGTKSECDDEVCSVWGRRDEGSTAIAILAGSFDEAKSICLSDQVNHNIMLDKASELNAIINLFDDLKSEEKASIKSYIDSNKSILEAETDECFRDITGPDHPCNYAGMFILQIRALFLLNGNSSDQVFFYSRDDLRKKVLDKHSILIADNGWFNTKTLEAILDFYDKLPNFLFQDGILFDAPFAVQTVRDAFQCRGQSVGFFAFTNRGFNVFKTQVGDSREQGFPGDTPEKPSPADLQLVVTRHEAAHQFDRTLSSRLVKMKDMLKTASRGLDENWLRSNVGDDYFQAAPQEIIASQIGNQYFQSTSAQLRLAAYRLSKEKESSSFPIIEQTTLTKSEHECPGANKNLGTHFGTPALCAAAAKEDPDCSGIEIMWSDSYNYAWGCRCCKKLSLDYREHDNWDIYQYRNALDVVDPIITGLPMSWFLFNLDLMTPTNSNKGYFYENEIDGHVQLVEIKLSRDDKDRINSIDVPSCGTIEFSYAVDGLVQSVSNNALNCNLDANLCYDSAKKFIADGKWKGCAVVSKYPKKCRGTFLEHCHQSCGVCPLHCKDEESFRYNNKKWLRWKCNGYVTDQSKCNHVDKFGRVVKNHCPLSCGNCKDLCKDDETFKIWRKIDGTPRKLTCKDLPMKNFWCKTKVKRKRIEEICRQSCNFCGTTQG